MLVGLLVVFYMFKSSWLRSLVRATKNTKIRHCDTSEKAKKTILVRPLLAFEIKLHS